MNEYTLIYQFMGALAGLFLASFLYSLGGRSGKWKRRVLASFVLAMTVNVISAIRGMWSPWFLIIFPTLFGGFSVGYGADFLADKLIKRTFYALAVIFSGLVLAFVIGGNAWWVLVFHGLVGASSIYLGVKNPLPAAIEEILVCLVLNLGLICYPFTGGV